MKDKQSKVALPHEILRFLMVPGRNELFLPKKELLYVSLANRNIHLGIPKAYNDR